MPTLRYIVNDVEKSVRFYIDRLGFAKVENYGPAIAIIERDGLRLWLAGPPASASRPMPDGRRPEPGGWNRLVIEVDDIAAEYERLRSEGVTFRNHPFSGPGGTQVLLEDPSGNPIELFQHAQSS
jgi:catechol 2,3-dioxygenase-like lactoylglutathione lyase family enzyme